MKRSITRWTTTLATAALLGVPAAAMAQTPSPQQPPTEQRPPAQPPSAQPPAPEPPTARPPAEQPTPQPPAERPSTPSASPQSPAAATQSSSAAVSPQEHLRQAKAAVDSISTSAVTGRSRTQIADLKKHMSALEKAASTAPDASAAGRATSAPSGKSNPNWGTEVAAIDKILAELTAGDTPTATAGTPSSSAPTGTSGTSKATTSVALDADTIAKLKDARTHIVAFATAMSSPKGAVKEHEQATTAGDAPAAAPSATQSGTATAPAMTGGAAGASATPATPAAASPTPASTAAASSTPASPEAQSSTPAAATSQAQSAPPAGSTSQAPAAAASATAPQQAEQAVVRQHLTEARDTLAEMTKLPAAAQLQGETRNQVAQLISNFNELITTQSNWKASYTKVESSLNALLGPDSTDAALTAATPSPAPDANAPAGSNANASATPVGTSGAAKAELDPAIRAKLMDLRRNLNDFQKAAQAETK